MEERALWLFGIYVHFSGNIGLHVIKQEPLSAGIWTAISPESTKEFLF